MNKIASKKILFELGIILAIIVLGILIENFGFNYKYFKLEDNEKSILQLKDEDIILEDIELQDTELIITGENPSIKLRENKYISYLNIELKDQNKILKITPVKEGINLTEQKTYSGDFAFKPNSFIKINDYSDNYTFKIKVEVKENLTDNKEEKNINSIKVGSFKIDNTFTFNFVRYIFIISIGLLLFYFVYHRDIVKQKLHITFAVISLFIGINFAIMTPTFYTYDEKEHFVKAYQLANLDLGIKDNVPIGWADNIDDFFKSNGLSPIFDSYKERIQYQSKFSDDSYSKKEVHKTTAATYLFVPYIPQSIGIGFGVLFKLPFIITFYLGRISSLITYVLLGALIIKHAKIAKRLIFMIMLMPNMLYLAGAYSADGVTLLSSIAAVVVFLNIMCSKERNIGYKEVGVFLGSICILTMSKVSYAPLCLLMLAVPKIKFKENINLWLVKLGTLFISGVTAMLTFGFALTKDMNQWNIPGVDIKGQVSFILHNIFTYLYFAITSFINNIQEVVIAPGNLAYLGAIKWFYIYILVFMLFLVAIIDNEENIIKLNYKDKLIISTSTIIAWGLVVTALYISFTPVGNANIAGVQGRYLTPLLLPILLVFKNNKIISNYKKENLNCMIITIWSVILIGVAIKILLLFNI